MQEVRAGAGAGSAVEGNHEGSFPSHGQFICIHFCLRSFFWKAAMVPVSATPAPAVSTGAPGSVLSPTGTPGSELSPTGVSGSEAPPQMMPPTEETPRRGLDEPPQSARRTELAPQSAEPQGAQRDPAHERAPAPAPAVAEPRAKKMKLTKNKSLSVSVRQGIGGSMHLAVTTRPTTNMDKLNVEINKDVGYFQISIQQKLGEALTSGVCRARFPFIARTRRFACTRP